MILLDTNIVIAFFNGNNLVKRKIQGRIERVALSVLVVEVDALIAATTIANKATLVTANKKHFENIEGLKIEIWPTN